MSDQVSWTGWARAKRTAVEYLAVFIASIAFIASMFSLLVSGIGFWVAFKADQKAAVNDIRTTQNKAQIEEMKNDP